MSIQSNFPAIAPSLLLDFANTKQLDNRITFTRSTPAVYYDGKTTAMAEQNLTLQSQTFNVSPWAVSNTTVTANATTAPDGTNTADKIVEDTADSAHAVYQLIGTTSGSCTFSVYAKADTRSWLNINTYVAGVRNNWFDLTNGVTGTIASGCTATITSVGSGWYRCSITTTGGSPTYFELWLATANNVTTYAGNGTSGLFVWGAQFETRSAATAYTATTTQPITNYIPVLLSAGGNQARFDHNPTTGESLGLLIEEQRTNLALYSEQFDNAAWTKDNSSITVNTIVSPDGSLDGDKLYENTANGYHQTYQTFSTSSGVTYTLTIYAKAGERSIIDLYLQLPTSVNASFNLINGVATQVTGTTNPTMTNVGNGWWRCSITSTATGATTGYMNVIMNNGSTSFYTGNGFNGVYLWGAQLEAGSYPTSYIPTTSASATRTIDAASITGINFSSWFNAGQGSAYVEGTGAYAFSCTEGGNQSYGNFWLVGDISTSGVDRYITGNYNSTNQWESRQFSTKAQKMSLAYAFNDIAGTFNGTLQFTDSSAILPINLIAAYISPNMTGWVKKVSYYPIRVTNTQLQALTS